MARVVIIGAGLTGLSTAYHLEQAGFFDYKILEKEPEIGGLCRSVQKDGFIFDYTGHLLHINNPYVHEFITTIIGLDKFNYLPRESFIYSHETFTRYPFQTNLHGLPTPVVFECLSGFVARKKIRNPKTFYSWVLTNFGSGFAKHFFIPYQQKQFCLNATKFSANWTGRFVPQTSITEIINGALSDQSQQIGYNAHFYYPQFGGIAILPKSIQKQLLNPVLTNHEIKNLNLQKKIIYCTNGSEHPYDLIINTIPLNHLLKKIIDTSATNFSNQHRKLVASSVLNINLGTTKKNLTKKHWIYFPEKKFPFYRIGFPHNFSETMTPSNCSSLYIECAYRGVYNSQLIENAIEKTCEVFDIKQKEVVSTTILTIPTAYALYTPWRDTNIKNLLASLCEVGIYSVGRYGSWKYASMQEAILDGKEVAYRITHEQKTDLWPSVPTKKQSVINV